MRRMKRVGKRELTAFLLSLAMLCTVIPETVYAALPGKGEVIDSTGRADWDTINLEDAVDILEDAVQRVEIDEEGGYQVFKFIPEETKEYTFFGMSSFDTYGKLKSADGSLMLEDDDSGYNESDFSITAELTAGKTYYCVAQMYGDTAIGSFLCMISSTRQTPELKIGDIENFEILAYGKDTWYEGERVGADEVPISGLRFRLTFRSGLALEYKIGDSYTGSEIAFYGVYIFGKFKYLTEEGDADQTVENNAIVYSIADTPYDNSNAITVEVPVIFHAESPIESITLDQNPWEDQPVFQSEAYNIDNMLYGDYELIFTVNYTDGTAKTVNLKTSDSSTWIEDGYNESVNYDWREYDDAGNVQLGANAIVISYMGAAIEVPVTVVDEFVKSIQIVRNPSKMSYEPFDRWPDLYGMQLRITLNSGSSTTATITEHGSEMSIWDGITYRDLEAWFTTSGSQKYVEILCGGCSAYYYPTFQTYASVLKNAAAILPGQAVSVALDVNMKYKIFRFVPLDTKEYEIKSAGNFDTYVELLDANGNQLSSNDDNDIDGNFQLNYRLEAGKTYYFVVRMYSPEEVGAFTCTLGGASAYTIAYNLNGGTNNTANPTSFYGTAVSLQNPARPQYTFDGWYTDSAYKNKITQIPAGARQNYTLYAKWTKVSKPGKIKLTSASNGKAKKIAVKFKKAKDVDGYEIAYSTNKKFKKASLVTAKKTKATIGKLKKGKTYYVRVCAYKLDSTGQKIRGKWSASKKVTVKK